SPTKKLKVAFDDNVHIRIMDDWNEKSVDLVKEEVRVAIRGHLTPTTPADDSHYLRLLQLLGQNVLSPDAPNSALLLKYLRALEARVSLLGECKRLVDVILNLSWLGRDDEFAGAYTHFLLVLATVHVKYTEEILDRLVAHFERLPASAGRLPGHDVVSRSVMFDRLHAAIHLVIKRIPLAGTLLCVAIRDNSPNDTATSRAHLQYQRHVLQLAQEVPEVRSEVLAFIVQRSVSIDVQIQKDIDELDEESEDQLLQKPMSKDALHSDIESDSDLDSMSESEATSTEDQRRLKQLRLQVTKLDGSLEMLFEHYTREFDATAAPEDNLEFQELLSHFTSLIMINRSRHAQFLVFHFAQQSPEYAAYFIQECIRIIFGNSLHSHRLTACAYLGSFLARASHVGGDMIREVFSELCVSLDEMRRRYEPSCMGPDRQRYNLYYTVTQTLLYVFCFRWRDLVVIDPDATARLGDAHLTAEDILADNRDLTWLPGIKETLTRNIHSSLNPLKVCSPAIVGEFAKIANHLRFLYIFSIIERNKRIRLGRMTSFPDMGEWDLGRRGTALDSKSGDAHHQLEAYFPFDPYQLPQSKKWLQGEYNTWQLPHGMPTDEDDDDEDEDEDEDEEDEYESDDD
ncbi:RNA polymerase I-specific transcription initiation factor RRN3, partial [Dissoconium aciculare CBS 342.82]|uniref:RNA polymerase I-specific transcription initiation factor RRN3 n=1 Tax=Dissoconium aciculare CBS 342.82 TaxID=1314786 RepID=A0A6J3LUH9_9PEZI